ncbi:MAG: hypothetical protein ACRDZ6_10795, partial [Acidimicrobiales bacterium]
MGSTASNVELGLEPSVESGPLAEPLTPEVGADPTAGQPLAGTPLADEPAGSAPIEVGCSDRIDESRAYEL